MLEKTPGPLEVSLAGGHPSEPVVDLRFPRLLLLRAIQQLPGRVVLAGAVVGLGLLDEIADLLTNNRDFKVEIQGHTDSQGREVMNEQLSQARADARDRRPNEGEHGLPESRGRAIAPRTADEPGGP